ncbi:MAG: biopolymer transporter ExbD [Bdellovibrionota bacterium]
MGFVGGQNKKSLDVELNLLPVFDVLSVCICFLLMTVVWIQVGQIKTSQALGGQSQAETKNPPSVWLTVDEKSNVVLSFKHTKGKLGDQVVSGNKGQVNLEGLKNRIQSLSEKHGFEIALLMPSSNTSYDSIIQIMDSLKGANIKDVGLSPL